MWQVVKMRFLAWFFLEIFDFTQFLFTFVIGFGVELRLLDDNM